MRTRSRGAKRLAVASAVAVATLAVVASASAAVDDPVVLSVGHTDALDVHLEDGDLVLKVKDDTGTPVVLRDPADVLFQALPGARVTVPDNPTFGFLGNPGDDVYILPQTQDPALLWPGWSTETLSSGVFTGNQLQFRVLNVTGPGRFVLYQTAGLGTVVVLANSADGLPDNWNTPTGSHVHANWAFGATGRYTITFEVRATLSNGIPITTGPVQYMFQVGDLAGGGDEDIRLSIAGIRPEYRPGDPVTLTAVQSPQSTHSQYRWLVRPAGASGYSLVPGATTKVHSFTATEALDGARYIVRLHDNGSVVAQSPSAMLNVDGGGGPGGGDDDDDPPGAGGGEPIAFTDTAGNVFEEDIAWLSATGVTKGCNPPANDRFCPDDNVTRGQMAAFLVRALNLAETGSGFTDTAGSVFAADIARLAAAGVTKGCNPPANDRFCPDDNVTRGQMAAFLVRALNLAETGSGFTDTAGSVFAADIARLAAAGVTKGCNPPANDRFCPDDNVTRGQMAAFLRRALAE